MVVVRDIWTIWIINGYFVSSRKVLNNMKRKQKKYTLFTDNYLDKSALLVNIF